jgi:hypothetical protein
MTLRLERSLSMSICDCCGKEMVSVYRKKVWDVRTEIWKVYCEECYNREVFA